MDRPDEPTTTTPVKVTDVTLRDGHQSILATRMRTEDMEPIAGEMDQMGFHSMEVWGGATFDVAHRFLNEDPWERVRVLKRLMPKTPLQMLLRGQNLVGYRNYPDDVVKAFVHQSAEVGIDIFRVFDALNDERNMVTCFAAIKESGKHIQACLSYTITGDGLGGPVYTLEYYVKKALKLQEMGADSLCIKDMGGLLSPYDAYELVKALKAKLKIPIQLHTHYTSGMASMSALKAIEAGLDILDTSLAPFALRSSHPSVEAMAVAFKGRPREPELDMSKAPGIARHLERIFPKYRNFLDTSRLSVIDTQVISHQVPGGMISNLVAQLREADALDKLDQVHQELQRVRADLGFPPLVTPTSQIIGIQAVQNVLFGRYKNISNQVKDYVYGLYGQPPAPMDPDLVKRALKDYPRGQKPITDRPADHLEPEMEKAKKETDGIAKGIEDVLTYALFPATGMKFLRWKYGLEEPPAEVRPRTLEEVEAEDRLIREAKEGRLVANGEGAKAKGPTRRSFNVWVGDEQFQVDVEPLSEVPISVTRAALKPATVAPRPVSPPPVSRPVSPAPRPSAPAPTPGPAPRAASAAPASGDGTFSVVSPMPGTVIRYEVEVGQEVKVGQSVILIETMKMENSLPSPVDGKVVSLPCSPGQSVAKGEVLVVIETAGAATESPQAAPQPPQETGLAAPAPPPPEVAAPSPEETRAQPPRAESAAVEGATSVVSPMPGIVIRYEVEVGQEVKTGQSVILIETMKMENSLPSPVDGKVVSLPCSPGQSVAKGEVLAVIG